MRDLQTCAIHEAGHLVVAGFFEVRATWARIVPQGGVMFERPPEELGGAGGPILAGGDQAVELAEAGRPVPPVPAGMQASLEPPRPWPYPARRSWTDRRRLAQHLPEHGHLARKTARGILEAEWASVYRLAGALLASPTFLRGEEIDRLLGVGEREQFGPAVELPPGLLPPRRRPLMYDASASSSGLYWAPSAPRGADEVRPPARQLTIGDLERASRAARRLRLVGR